MPSSIIKGVDQNKTKNHIETRFVRKDDSQNGIVNILL